ncbi:MAG: RIP metalloprotease RseP [Janthinobacterium lividum]
MLSIIGFILVTCILVFVHEMGHFLIAKLFKVKVEEFSIGFGKEIFSRVDKSGVKWKLAAIPLGGFVKMHGDLNSMSTKHIDVQASNLSFHTKPLYARFLILAAGPAANYMLAVIILAGFYFSHGKLEIPAIIGEVVTSSPADKGGLKSQDRVLEINRNKIDEFNDIRKQIMINDNQPMHFMIQRGDKLLQLTIIPINKDPVGKKYTSSPYIGISSKIGSKFIKLSLISSFSESIREAISISKLTLQALWQMILGNRSTDQMHGPFVIAKESGETLARGPVEFILLLSMLSINLGLMNLLPVPLLDGGHLLFMIYEGIVGKPLGKNMQNILLRVGMMIIIFLVVISVSNDIKSLLF